MKRNLNRLMGLLLTIALAIGLMAGMSITALADNTGAYNSYLVKSNDTEDALANLTRFTPRYDSK